MDKRYISKTDTPSTNKAFMLLEMVVVLFITTIMFSLSLNITTINFDDYLFISNYHLAKAKSMATHTSQNVHHKLPFKHIIYFNEDGNINMSQSIKTNRGKLTIYLGPGYIKYEK